MMLELNEYDENALCSIRKEVADIERILKIIPNAFLNLQELGLNGPYVILTSLLDVKDRMFSYHEHGFSTAKSRQNDMIFQSILITNPSDLSEYDRILKELFMNTAGHFLTQFSL